MRPPSEGVFAFCHNSHPGTNPAGAGATRPPVGISRPTAGYRRGACTCPRRRRLRSLCALSVSALMRPLAITIPGTLALLLLNPSRRAVRRPIPPLTGHQSTTVLRRV